MKRFSCINCKRLSSDNVVFVYITKHADKHIGICEKCIKELQKTVDEYKHITKLTK